MKFLLSLAVALLLLSGCEKENHPSPTWEYKTVVVRDAYYAAGLNGDPRDKGYFGSMDVQKALGEDRLSNRWEMCGCFLEPGTDPRLILIFKRPAF